jgi:DHA2 family multidrug resistance protein
VSQVALSVADPRRPIIAASTMLATLLYTVDMTIANVALPQIQGGLQATQDQVLWVLTSYIVTSAIVTPLTGFLAARFGGRLVLLGSVAGFTLFSMLCGLATSLPELVLFRVLQGVSGAALVPISQSVLLSVYAREEHGHAFAIWSMGVLVGPVLGPTLGGYLTETWSWRWVFYVNVPVGILALIGIASSIPRETGLRRTSFDIFGYALLALGLGFLQLFADRGSGQGWFESSEILAEAGAAVLLLYMFVAHSLTARHAFFEPALFRDRNFVAAVGIMLVVGLMFISSTALVPTFLQRLQGYPVLTSGEIMVTRGLGMMAAMVIGGRLVRRIDPRILMAGATVLMFTAMWPLAHISLDTTATTIAVASFFQGAGMGMTFLPVNVVAFASLAPELRTDGTVFLTLARNLGSAVGVSIVGAELADYTAANQSRLVEFFSSFDVERWRVMESLFPGHAAEVTMSEISRQATVLAFDNVFWIMMAATIALLPLILLCGSPQANKPKPADPADVEQLV